MYSNELQSSATPAEDAVPSKVKGKGQTHAATHYILMPCQSSQLTIGVRSHLDLYDRCGRLLLAKGQPVPPQAMELLHKREVFLLHNVWKDNSVNVFSKQLHQSAAEKIRRLFHDIQLIEPEQLKITEELVDALVRELEEQLNPVIDFNQFRRFDDFTHIHSVNVSLIASLIGMSFGYQGQMLRQLALAAMLHDIGKLHIPQEILNKPGRLTNKESDLIKMHPDEGEKMLRKLVPPPEIASVIRHHHERWNGSGYPDSLKGSEISLNAQIVAVADVFDAVIADRPYRKGIPPYHAVELIIGSEGTAFAPKVVDAFLRAINLYPPRSLVTLSSGETGVVIDVPKRYPTRPRVRLLIDAQGDRIKKEIVIDLMQTLNCFITAVQYS